MGVQSGPRRNAPNAEGVVPGRNQARDRRAVVVFWLVYVGGGVAVATVIVVQASADVGAEVVVVDIHTIIHHRHVDALPLDAIGNGGSVRQGGVRPYFLHVDVDVIGGVVGLPPGCAVFQVSLAGIEVIPGRGIQGVGGCGAAGDEIRVCGVVHSLE